MSIRLGFVCLLFLIAGLLAASEPLEVVYPRSQSAEDNRFADLVALLDGALSITQAEHGPYHLTASARAMSELRYLNACEQGEKPSVVWYSASEDLEQRLLPIRIPLRRGLLGYRAFLIRAEDQSRFSSITDVAGLRALRVGQGADWGDVHVFEGNNMPVVTGGSYEGLFDMLVAGRFDYFSRGIAEIGPEFEARKQRLPNMAIEQDLLLYYPWPYYFYVNKKDTALAARLETGLRAMIANGSFERIFQQYNGSCIHALQLSQRRLISIDNPLLPAATPLDEAALWYRPER